MEEFFFNIFSQKWREKIASLKVSLEEGGAAAGLAADADSEGDFPLLLLFPPNYNMTDMIYTGPLMRPRGTKMDQEHGVQAKQVNNSNFV